MERYPIDAAHRSCKPYRLSSLENTQARHEGMFTTLRDRTDDHERRLAKTEATMDAVSLDLREIKADVKSLVRGTP